MDVYTVISKKELKELRKKARNSFKTRDKSEGRSGKQKISEERGKQMALKKYKYSSMQEEQNENKSKISIIRELLGRNKKGKRK